MSKIDSGTVMEWNSKSDDGCVRGGQVICFGIGYVIQYFFKISFENVSVEIVRMSHIVTKATVVNKIMITMMMKTKKN